MVRRCEVRAFKMRVGIPELIDLGSVSGWRQLAGDKVVEDVDELAKDEVHEREDGAGDDHAEECNGVEEPPLFVIIRKYSLSALDISA